MKNLINYLNNVINDMIADLLSVKGNVFICEDEVEQACVLIVKLIEMKDNLMRKGKIK